VDDRSTLEETIALLEATLESTHDGILVVDVNRRIIRFNRHFLRMFRFTAEELDRDGLDAVLAGLSAQVEDPESLLATSRDLWSNLTIEVLDVLRFKDGRVFERYVAPHRIGSRVVGRVASFRDVGQSVRTAEALEQHRSFLEKAQEVAHVGSWVAELDGSRRLGWSAETHRIYGVPMGQFDGSFDAFLTFVHPDDREMVMQAGARAAAQKCLPYHLEHRIVLRDGRVRWVHERASVVCDPQGRALRMVGTVQDVTARRLLEEQLRQSQKMEAIGRLAGGIAHDLNNTLTAIAGYAELALTEVAGDHPARADVEEIRRAAERAGAVTRQLLAFSRKQTLEPRVFDLNETITSIARLLSRLLGGDVHVQVRLATDPLHVLGDPRQIEQAVINLAVNARDAMPGGGQLVLTTSFEDVDEEMARASLPMAPGRYVVLRVTDTGHGMSSDTQSQIFEPFFTTKDVGKGTGLGLSMVYGTVKQIGGFIFVESEIDHGTTFRLYFPPSVAPPAAEPSPAEPTPGAPAPEPSRKKRVPGQETLLIAEDEPAVRKLVASALRNDGYQLLLASSAEEALVMADAHNGTIDLLLTDAMMPGKSGLELASLLAETRPGLPVIVMSGYTQEDLSVSGFSQPIGLLQKPFTPKELRRRIREVLDR
jgi:two-component system cell cycle sensor histidine kinase/response regulator CckA